MVFLIHTIHNILGRQTSNLWRTLEWRHMRGLRSTKFHESSLIIWKVLRRHYTQSTLIQTVSKVSIVMELGLHVSTPESFSPQIFDLLVYYATLIGGLLQTFRDDCRFHLQGLSSLRSKQLGPCSLDRYVILKRRYLSTNQHRVTSTTRQRKPKLTNFCCFLCVFPVWKFWLQALNLLYVMSTHKSE